MLASAHAEENGSHRPSVFLTHASPPSHIAADSELINSAFVGSRRNRWLRAREGFNRRVSISVLTFDVSDFTHLDAPKLWHVRLGLNPSVTISTDFFGYFLSRKESDIVHQYAMVPTKSIFPSQVK
jgi:hypothetical protein